MSVQITIVGLGQIGASVGLALGDHRELVRRVGHDRDSGIARRAEKMGALDKVVVNLPSAVREADLVLLALPIDQMRDTLAVIREDLKEGVVVMDTGPVKEIVAAWAAEILPPERYYVGLTPVINPAYLHEVDTGVEAAHPDLFRNGLMSIIAPRETPSEAIKLAADLTRLLGATPLFADPLEMDGLMAATQTLPQLMAAALLTVTIDQPGWREGRKIAGRSYAETTISITHPTEAATLRAAALFNRENVLRVLDGLIASLQSIRNDIHTQDAKALDERLARAQRGREEWLKQRTAANWLEEELPPAKTPTSSEWFGRLLGIRKKRDT